MTKVKNSKQKRSKCDRCLFYFIIKNLPKFQIKEKTNSNIKE